MNSKTEQDESQGSPEEAFLVQWQLGRDRVDDSPVTQAAQDEEVRMLQRRLLRLYSIYQGPT